MSLNHLSQPKISKILLALGKPDHGSCVLITAWNTAVNWSSHSISGCGMTADFSQTTMISDITAISSSSAHPPQASPNAAAPFRQDFELDQRHHAKNRHSQSAD
jgi:hypothetical protein